MTASLCCFSLRSEHQQQHPPTLTPQPLHVRFLQVRQSVSEHMMMIGTSSFHPASFALRAMDGPATDATLDRALGALMGACIGDACGATLERLGRAPTPAEVAHAWRFPGGGFLRVAPGQCTDDGELTVALARALAGATVCSSLAQAEALVAASYAEWALSRPFDMGITTGASIGLPLTAQGNSAFAARVAERGLAAVMRQGASALELQSSQSNGSLMRCAALGVWGRFLCDADLARLAHADSSLSHVNRNVCDAVAAYSMAVAHLMLHAGDGLGAYRRAVAWAAEHATGHVQAWLAMAPHPTQVVPFTPDVGFVKIGFVYAFRCLLLATSPQEAILATLAGGGDTDTNAAIVAALVGAKYGYAAFPAHARAAVESCNTDAGRPRPDWLHPKHLHAHAAALLERAPVTLLAPAPEPADLGPLLPPPPMALSAADYECEDSAADGLFYAEPRFVHHLSAGARASLTAHLRRHLAPPVARVLDLCSSWVSHLPAEALHLHVTGLGLSLPELQANPRLAVRLVHDCNAQPDMPCLAGLAFDAAVCVASIDYLRQPVRVLRALRARRVIVVLTDRYWPAKVLRVWERLGSLERVSLVSQWLRQAGYEGVCAYRLTLPAYDDGYSDIWALHGESIDWDAQSSNGRQRRSEGQ